MKKLMMMAVAAMAAVVTAWGYDTSSYAQDGLILHWDAINNAGTGVHSPLATVWKDLAGSYDMTLTTSGSWLNGDTFVCDGVKEAANYGATGPTASMHTIEIVYRQSEQTPRNGGILFNSGNAAREVIVTKDGTQISFKGQDKCVSYATLDALRHIVAATFTKPTTAGVVSNVYNTGVAVVNPAKFTDSFNAGDGKMHLGGRVNSDYPYKGEINAIRIYSRALTDEEIAKNAKIDTVRYLGATPDDVLVIAGEPYNVPCAVDPSYAGRDNLQEGDEVTLTAPSGEITSTEGHKITCTGYKVYDAAGDVVASGSDLSYTYTHQGAYRRFAWQFTDLCHVTVSGEGGTYSETDVWLPYGTNFTFTVTPNEGKFVRTVSNSYDGETWAGTTVTKKIVSPMDFTVVYGQGWYVSPTGDDAKDGKTHATAKATIAAAAALADTGDTVVLMAGEHAQPSAQIKMSKAYNVVGESGVDKTFIKLTANVGVFTLATAGARVSGITFYGANKTTGVGCPISIGAVATAEDCVIRDAYLNGNTTVYVKNGGTVRNIHIRGIKSNGRCQAGFELVSANDLAEYCSVIGCEGNNNDLGCAAYLRNGTMRNCLIACNTNKNTQTAAAYITGASFFENCTVVDNVCLGSGTRAGVVLSSPTSVNTVKNCLIAGNCNTAGELNWSGTETKFVYNCTTPVPGGTGNVLAVNPDFTDRANFDYTLKSGNAIDAGLTTGWHASATDLAGNDRVIGSAVDMGCYEYTPGALAASAVPSTPSLVGEGEVTLQASAAGTNLVGVIYTWTIKNDVGETVLTDMTYDDTFTHQYGYGRYTVTLDVVNDAGEKATWTAEKAFSVIPTTVYVATDSTPVYPYATKATAANDLATALEATVDGSTVIVCDGEYPVTANIAITKNVTVKSENGVDKVSLYTEKAIRMLTMNAANARFEDITLRSDGKSRSCSAASIAAGTMSGCVVSNFYSSGMELIYLSSTSAVVTNCLVAANRSTGRINTIDISGGGTITHSRIVGNTNDNDCYGSAIQLYTGLCIVRNCLIAGNTNLNTAASAIGSYSNPTAGSLVENCTIVGNHIVKSSVNTAVRVNKNVKFRNCVITGNSNSSGEANWDTTSANVSYTCTTPLPSGEKNIEPSGTLFTDDEYHIKSGILVDAGLNQDWMTNGFDLDGNDRLFEGGIVDLGCYEYVPGALECSVSPSSTVRLGEGEMVLTATVSSKSDDLVYTWLVTNQVGEVFVSTSGTGLAVITNDYPYGYYSVKLTVSQGETTSEFYEGDLFSVKPATVYLAKGSTPTFPYGTHETAFAEYDDALAFAESGMTIFVGDGIFTNVAHVGISKDVTITSEHGADKSAIFSINDANAWTINSAGAVVKDLTLFSDGDIFLDETYKSKHQLERWHNGIVVLQGTLANCVITNWFAYYTPVMEASGGVTSSVVTNCLVTKCKSAYRTHFMALGGGTLVTNCRIVDNVADAEAADYASIVCFYSAGTLRSSLIANNVSIRKESSTACYATAINNRTSSKVLVENCTVVSNVTSNTRSPAVYCESGNGAESSYVTAALTVRNSIIWGNVNGTGVLDWLNIANCFSTCCCSTPGLPAGNLTTDPLFNLRNGVFRPKYSLTPDSPCIDQAAEQPWMTGATDLKGNPRIIGAAPDIGAYERPPAQGLMLLVK